jgi:two-component system nitrogen regulation response regulator NtrX
MLCNYPWPGNVRELKNLVERLAIMVEKDIIEEFDLPAPYNPDTADGMTTVESQLFLSRSLKDAKNAFEREFIKRKLSQYNNNITKTAEAIGVKRSYLHKKIKGLDVG